MRIGFQRFENRAGLFRRVGRTLWTRLCQGDFAGVEMGHEPSVGPVGMEGTAAVAGHPRDRDVSEVVDWPQQLARPAELLEDEPLIVARIGPAVDPVGECVTAGAPVEKIHRADDLALVREIDLDRIVHSAAGERLDFATAELGRPDPRAFARFHDLPRVVVGNGKALATVRPEKASVRMQKGSVHIGGVAGEIKTGREFLLHLGAAVPVLVGEAPEARRRHHVERVVNPKSALRESEFVGKECGLVKDAVSICVLQHPDRARPLAEKSLFVQIHPRIFRNKKSTAIIERRHDRMFHQPRRHRRGHRDPRINYEIVGDERPDEDREEKGQE